MGTGSDLESQVAMARVECQMPETLPLSTQGEAGNKDMLGRQGQLGRGGGGDLASPGSLGSN